MLRKRYLFLIMFICFFAISAVSAQDNSTSDILSVSNDVNSLESNINSIANDTDTLKVSGDEVLYATREIGNASVTGKFETAFSTVNLKNQDSIQKTMTDLQNTIKNNKNTTIFLEDDYQWSQDNLENGIIIDKSITIDGQGHKIDANHKMRIFQVTNAAIVTFKNINFLNGSANEYGGAVFNNGAKNITIINCTFTGNTASCGGAISDCIAINCTFINNTAGEYGGCAIYGWYGFSGNLTGTFINNTANKGGGVICIFGDGFSGNLGGIFINNTANTRGGVIFINSGGVSGNLGGIFINNTATEDGGVISIYGGFSGNLGGIFINNTANTHGGAISINTGGFYGNLNGTFINNTATGDGGAISINTGGFYGNLNGTFINNTATGDGGAIHIKGDISGNLGGVFINNTATGDGGAIYISYTVYGNLDGVFINNTATGDGGAIYISSGGVSGNLTGTFINNTARSGGAIYSGGVSGNLTGTFINNTARSGGAIDIFRVSGNLNGTFINNTANKGGAIYINDGGVSGNLDSIFINNTATGDGGAIYISYGGVSGNLDSIFINNTATGDGGAIYINSGGFSGNLDSIFINNTATGSGGAIYISRGVSGNLGGTFINNIAEEYGGAIFIYEDGVSGNLSCTFINNTANKGGAIYIDGTVHGNLDGTYINNTAKEYGGAIYILYCRGSSNLTGTYINNKAKFDGGAIYIYNNLRANSIIKDAIFINNNNAIVVNVGNIPAINCWFGNNATNYNIKPEAENINIDNWLFLNATVNSTEISIDQNSIITFKLESYSNTSGEVKPYNASNMNIILDLTQTLGKLDKNTALIGENVTYTAKQGGNASIIGKFVTASYTIELNNVKIPTEINITNSTIALKANEEVDTGATLIPADAGSLTYTSSNTTVAIVENGMIKGLKEGTTIITVTFEGNAEYAPAKNKTINVTVKLRDASVSVNNDTLNLTVNDTFELVATTDPRGLNVTYSSNNESVATVDANGKVTAKAKGTTIITASVGGDGVYALNSTTVSVTVNEKPIPPKENLTLDASAEPITVGENATVVVTGFKDATGNVSVTVNDKTYAAPVKNGGAEVIVYGLTESVTASVNYTGDNKYNPASATVNITVNSNVIIYAPDVTKYYGGSERFAVTLNDLNGNPIADADIKITVNGQTYTKTTDKNGETSIAINLNSGVYNVTTEYNGTKVYSTVTVKDTVIAKDVTKIFRNGTQYQGIFVDSKGNLVKNTDIQININGVFYTRTTDANGMAQLNINLPPGTYILTAINPSSGEQHTTIVTVLPNIVENYDLTKYYKNASQYSLRLLDDKGNPVGAGVSIQLNINGIFYTRTSDANGYVKMNINLPPGTYIITAEYKGLRMSNTIKVLTVLEANDLVMRYHDGSQFKAKVLDGQGNPYVGQTVTYNINGVFYTKISGDDGIAGLTINLPAGEYIITSMYNGLNVANKVTIIG